MSEPEIISRLRKTLALCAFLGAMAAANAQSAQDWEEIRAQSIQLSEVYAQLLQTLSMPDLPASQKEKIIANSFDPQFPRAIFYQPSATIEFDLSADYFQRGSGIYQDIPDYLTSFDLFYSAGTSQDPIAVRLLGCKTFHETYPGMEVVFELSLPGADPQGLPFGKARKRMETIAVKEGSLWRVYVKGIAHIADLPEGYACQELSPPPQPFHYLDNAFFGFNFQLYNGAWASYRRTTLADFGLSLYAPVGGYLFGFSNTAEASPFEVFTLPQIEQLYAELVSQGVDIPQPDFSRYRFTGTRFHAGVCLGPFYRIKRLRRLYFTGGFTYLDGMAWEEYQGDFNGRLSPSYGEDAYAVSRKIYNRETRLEGGIALVFPFAHAEVTYHAYQKAFAWKVGLNWPLSGWERKF